MPKKTVALAIAFVCLIAAPSMRAESPGSPKVPRLILQITVDQLRGDLPLRYQDRFTDGGFRYLLKHGTWYAAAFHPHAHTETIVGHTTLATGAYPSRHGMIANVWYDRKTGKLVHNIEGSEYPILSVTGEKQSGKGVSPKAILSTTFSDELTLLTAGRARVYAISAKDRGAVPLAGHSGKAFWLSNDNGCFVSSTFYYTAYPDWVKSWCQGQPAKRFENSTWNLLRDPSTYLYRDWTNQYPEHSRPAGNMKTMRDTFGFGSTFPHTIKAGRFFSGALSTSPGMDELTLEFAKKLLREEHLGEDAAPDYLAISFSATDLIGHWFSPASLESEDNLLRLDAVLADLFSFVDKKVGLENTLIILAGDHGGPEYPEYLHQHNIESGWVTSKEIMTAATAALSKRFGSVEGLISRFSAPYVYVDRKVVASHHLDVAEVERVIAHGIAALPGIAVAMPSADLATSSEGDSELVAEIRRNFNPDRSGDVYIVQEPLWQIEEKEDGGGSFPLVQHGSPWPYDTFVPVAFAGAGVPANMVFRRIYTVDVAATLSAFVRAKYPSASVGVPLTEVLGGSSGPH